MNCDLQPTGETNWQGRAVYACAREGCPNRIAPRDESMLAPLGCLVDRTPEPPRHDSASLPCIHRGEPTGDKVSCGCGARGVKIDVYRCAQFAICTVISPAKVTRIGQHKPAVCLGCEMRA